MPPKRFFHSPISPGKIEIIGPEAHHIKNVMRMEQGQPVEIFDGQGQLANGVITEIKRQSITVSINEIEQIPAREIGNIIVVASLAKADRFDWLVSKCTELGVDRICPAIFDRTIKQPKNPKFSERMLNLAISSAKQCQRLFLPVIDNPMPLEKIIAGLQNEKAGAQWITASLEPGADNISQLITKSGKTDYIAIVGPEGGITDAENEMLRNINAAGIRLTQTILRTETAAIAMATILCTMRDSQDLTD